MNTVTPYNPLLATIEREIDKDSHLKSPHTARMYRFFLRSFEEWRDGRALTKSLVEEYASTLQKQSYAPATINRHLAAIRWWARRVSDMAEEHMESEAAGRIAKQAARVITVRDVKGERPPRGRYLPREEQNALLSACSADPTPAGVRDAAMIAVALSVGLRRDDLTTLEMTSIKHITEDSCDLVIHGKGDRIDTLYLYNGGFRRLMAWLQVRGNDPGRVFCEIVKSDKTRATAAQYSSYVKRFDDWRAGRESTEELVREYALHLQGEGLKSGTVEKHLRALRLWNETEADKINTTGKLSGEALRKILDVRQVGLGLPEHLTWHDFRKTFICGLLDKAQDLSTVQKLARHRSPNTTANIYDIRGEKVKRAAVRTLEVGE